MNQISVSRIIAVKNSDTISAGSYFCKIITLTGPPSCQLYWTFLSSRIWKWLVCRDIATLIARSYLLDSYCKLPGCTSWAWMSIISYFRSLLEIQSIIIKCKFLLVICEFSGNGQFQRLKWDFSGMRRLTVLN